MVAKLNDAVDAPYLYQFFAPLHENDELELVIT